MKVLGLSRIRERKWPNTLTKECRDKILVVEWGTEWSEEGKWRLGQVQRGPHMVFL